MPDTDPRLAALEESKPVFALAYWMTGRLRLGEPAGQVWSLIRAVLAALPPYDHAAELDRLRETLLAAKAANENVLRLLAYWRLSEGHPGIFAREVDAALDAALRGADYQPLDVSHGQQVNWTRDRLRAVLEPR